MTQEYEEKLKLAIGKLCHWDKALSDDENQRIVDEGFYLLKEVAATKDNDVLYEMFDVFNDEDQDDALANGVCETLENEIYRNFDLDQIISVLYKKFDSLIASNVDRAVYFSESILSARLFEDFRKMFNTVKAKKSSEFLDRFHRCYPEFEENIFILRRDMAKW